jgi:O-antigen/teichoic acid export membrane protein
VRRGAAGIFDRGSSRDTAGSLATAVAAQVLLVASGVLVARLLGPTDRGHLAFLLLVPVIIVKLGGLGIPLAVTYEAARTPAAAPAMLAGLRRVIALQCAAMLLAHAVAVLLVIKGESTGLVVAGLLTLGLTPAMMVTEYALSMLQGLRLFGAFNTLRLLPVALYSLGVVAAFAVGVESLPAVAAVWSGATVAIALVTARYAVRAVRKAPGGEPMPPLRAMTAFGLRALLGSASPVETFRLDQAVIGLFLAPIALGYYVAALSFTNLPRFLAQSLGMVATPHVATRNGRDAVREAWRFVGVALVMSAAVVAGLELVVGGLLPWLFGEEFEDAVPLARILLLSAFFLSLRRVITDAVRGLGRPTVGTVAELSSWIFLAPALVVAAPGGVTDVAVAVMLSSAFSLLVLVVAVVLGRSDGDAAWVRRTPPVQRTSP